MNKLTSELSSQRSRLNNALSEKDNLLNQRDSIDRRTSELDKIILDARAIIAGIQFSIKVQEEDKQDLPLDGED